MRIIHWVKGKNRSFIENQFCKMFIRFGWYLGGLWSGLLQVGITIWKVILVNSHPTHTPDLFLYENKVNGWFFYLSVNRMLKQMLEDFFQRIRTSRHEFTATISIFWCNNTCMYNESRRYLCLSSSRGDEHDRENGLSSHGNETEHWNTTFWFLWTCSMTQLKVPWSKPPYGGQIL